MRRHRVDAQGGHLGAEPLYNKITETAMKNEILLAVLACAPAFAASDAPAILQRKCAQCHGASNGSSGLSVTSRESLLRGGSRGAALIPGKSAESLIYRAIAHI
jgi:hypothetical protein